MVGKHLGLLIKLCLFRKQAALFGALAIQIIIVALESTSAVFHNIQTLPLKEKLELHQVKRKNIS